MTKVQSTVSSNTTQLPGFTVGEVTMVATPSPSLSSQPFKLTAWAVGL